MQLSYTHITSPISGRVGLRLVDPGNIVHASDVNGMLVITQLQPISVLFSLAEDYLPQIRQQLRRGNRLAVDALDRTQQNKLSSGTLLTFDNEIDTTTGTIKLKAIFPNGDSALFPNQFVNARLLVDTQHNVILVPNGQHEPVNQLRLVRLQYDRLRQILFLTDVIRLGIRAFVRLPVHVRHRPSVPRQLGKILVKVR